MAPITRGTVRRGRVRKDGNRLFKVMQDVVPRTKLWVPGSQCALHRPFGNFLVNYRLANNGLMPQGVLNTIGPLVLLSQRIYSFFIAGIARVNKLHPTTVKKADERFFHMQGTGHENAV